MQTIDERLALDRIERIGKQVRAESRWYGISCLRVAIAAYSYVMIVHRDGPGSGNLILLFGLVLAGLGGLWWRYGRNEGS